VDRHGRTPSWIKPWRLNLLLEQNVRQDAATIDLSFVGGIAKARQFLRLAKRIRDNALKVGALSIHFAHRGEWEKANRFRCAYDRLSDLHSEIRERARTAIRQPVGMGFDVSPTPPGFAGVRGVTR